MKTQALITYCLILLFTAGISRPLPAQNQHEMNQQAQKDFESADLALNKAYKQLFNKLDEPGRKKLKEAQRAWVVFRDAEAELQADLDARGGSMAPLIYDGRRCELTKARTKELQEMLKDYGG